MRLAPGNDLILGTLAGSKTTLTLPRTARDKHLYVCGGTGTGKSKFLESLICQDIIEWQNSKCGALVIDPHGSLYDSLIRWLAWNKDVLGDCPVVPIDLRKDNAIISYNLLRQRNADPAVLVSNLTAAMAHVWGQTDVKSTPLFARWIGNVLRPLYEKNLTLVEADYLLDQTNKVIRYAITHDVTSKAVQNDWRMAATLSPADFEAQVGSTVNRLRPFLDSQILRSIFGQPGVSLDLGTALEEGQIILVCAATEGAKVSEENAQLFATLLLSDLWTAAQERGKRESGEVKPFYVYLDEFQRFVTPTIAKNLDQARGFGLHLTMAHQFPKQLLDEGDHGRRVYNSVMENASSKVAFRLTDEENLMPIAKWLFRGIMNPDEVKHELHSTKVMEYREELREILGESTSTSESVGTQSGSASGAGLGGTHGYYGDGTGFGPRSTSESESDFSSSSSSESKSYSSGKTRSKALVPTTVPVLGKEVSSVQFRSIEEQVFRAMAVLSEQQERFFTARSVAMKAPVTVRSPDIGPVPGSPERTIQYLTESYAKIPFALPGDVAKKQLLERAENLPDLLMEGLRDLPAKTKRRIR